MIGRRTINESVAIVLESMGVGKTRGGAPLVHAYMETDWPRELFSLLTEYRQKEQSGDHGSGFPGRCVLMQWSGSHLTESSEEDAKANNTAYLFLHKATTRIILAQQICMCLGVLAQEGAKLVGGNYFSAKNTMNLTQSTEEVNAKMWEVLSGCFGLHGMAYPSPEEYRKQFRRFGLPVPRSDVPPGAEKRLDQFPDLEDEVIELSKRGVVFVDMESVKPKSHQDTDVLRNTLDVLRDGGAIADYDESYDDESGIPTFTVLSESAGQLLDLGVDSDKVGAIIESVREGKNMAVVITENKTHGTTRSTHGVKVKWFHHLVEVIAPEGTTLYETESFETARDMAAKIAADIDKGVPVNEAVEPYSSLITD